MTGARAFLTAHSNPHSQIQCKSQDLSQKELILKLQNERRLATPDNLFNVLYLFIFSNCSTNKAGKCEWQDDQQGSLANCSCCLFCLILI